MYWVKIEKSYITIEVKFDEIEAATIFIEGLLNGYKADEEELKVSISKGEQ